MIKPTRDTLSQRHSNATKRRNNQILYYWSVQFENYDCCPRPIVIPTQWYEYSTSQVTYLPARSVFLRSARQVLLSTTQRRCDVAVSYQRTRMRVGYFRRLHWPRWSWPVTTDDKLRHNGLFCCCCRSSLWWWRWRWWHSWLLLKL